MVKMINEKIRKTFATSVFYMLRRQRKYKHARKNMMV
jgi:preprotein translocase subunit YajC